jgi:hypothetical protein
MKTFSFCTAPIEFDIESNCDTPEEALEDALMLDTENEVKFLNFPRDYIDDQLTLDGVECMFVNQDGE